MRNLKDDIIEKISSKMGIPAKDVEAVVSHQFKAALKAMDTNDSVELSGFGKFIYMPKSADRILRTLKEASLKMERGEIEKHERMNMEDVNIQIRKLENIINARKS